MADSQLESALSSYETLDVSAESELRRQLFAHLDTEAADKTVKLSDPYSTGPAHLTDGMLNWFNAHVSGLRSAALQAVSDAFSAVATERKAQGTFVERDRHRIEARLMAAKRNLRRSHRDQHQGKYKERDELRKQENELQHQFNALRDKEGNRPPRILNWGLYLPVLLAVGVAELMLNFETFNALNFFTPFIATAFAMVIGACLAFAAHLHGTLLKQLEYHIGVKERDSKRMAAWKMFGLGTTALTVVLVAVGYARAQYLSDYIQMQDVFSGGGDTNGFWVIAGSLLGNVIVWIIGVIFAYMMHDRNPDYPEKAVELRKASAERARLERRLEEPLRREIERLEAEAADELEKLEASDQAQRGLESYRAASSLLGRFKAQDGRVLAALSAYRSELKTRNTIQGAEIAIPSAADAASYDYAPLSDYGLYDLELKLT